MMYIVYSIMSTTIYSLMHYAVYCKVLYTEYTVYNCILYILHCIQLTSVYCIHIQGNTARNRVYRVAWEEHLDWSGLYSTVQHCTQPESTGQPYTAIQISAQHSKALNSTSNHFTAL